MNSEAVQQVMHSDQYRPDEGCCGFPEQACSPSAGLGSRITAFLIDITILLLILGIGALAVADLVLSKSPGSFFEHLIMMSLSGILIGSFHLVFIPVYFLIFHALGGETPGKLVMGIRVVNGENQAIRPGASFLRVVGYLLSGIPLGTGFIWILFDQDKRAWHDKLAGTRVVYT